MMNMHIRNLADVGNPFKFKHITNINEMEAVKTCVILAAPGMLQNGTSRQLMESICDDQRNGVLLAGYSTEGTLAHKLLSHPKEMTCLDGRIKPLRCSIEYISFSAHVDFTQNLGYMKSVAPKNIVLVHGEQRQMNNLKKALEVEIRASWPSKHLPDIRMPANASTLTYTIEKAITTELVGELASRLLDSLEDQNGISSIPASSVLPDSVVLINENFKTKAVEVDEMPKYTMCRRGRIQQRILVPIPPGLGFSASSASVGLNDMLLMSDQGQKESKFKTPAVLVTLAPFIGEVFDSVVFDFSSVHSRQCTLVVEDIVSLYEVSSSGANSSSIRSIAITWNASPLADTVADCIVSLVTQMLSAQYLLLGASAGPLLENFSYRSDDNSGTLSIPPREKIHKHSRSNEARDEEEALLLKRMKVGLIDPSKCIPGFKRRHFSRDRDKLFHLKARLKHCSSKLSSKEGYSSFRLSYVELNSLGDRLILRSIDDSGSIVAEAFCYILWAKVASTGEGPENEESDAIYTHHAVVKCQDDSFRSFVISALQAIGDDDM
jgi:hypothetical protein